MDFCLSKVYQIKVGLCVLPFFSATTFTSYLLLLGRASQVLGLIMSKNGNTEKLIFLLRARRGLAFILSTFLNYYLKVNCV